MTSFCPVCRNLLFINPQLDDLTFECRSCKTSIRGTPEDTLRYEEIEGSDITIYSKLLQKFADDPAGHKVRKPCPKCGHDIAKNVVLGPDMRNIYMCLEPSCRHQWV